MSVIPEYGKPKEPEKKEEGPKVSGVRKAAGVLGLIAGIFLFIGYIGATVSIGAIAAVLFKWVVLEQTNPSAGEILFTFTYFILAVIAFVIGVIGLLAGVRSLKKSPAGTVRSGLIAWSFLMLLYIIFGLVALAADENLREGVSLTPLVVSLIGIVLALTGGILVKPGASFGRWMAGSVLVLVGIIFVIVSLLMSGYPADFSEISEEFGGGSYHVVKLYNLLDPIILIPAIIGAVALIIAPFAGARNLWAIALLGIIAGLIAAVIVIYYAGTSIGDFWDLWKQLSEAREYMGESTEALLAVAFVAGSLTASIALTIAAIIGLVALILGLVHVVMKRGELFAAPAGGAAEPQNI